MQAMPALCCACGAALPLSQRRFPGAPGDWGSTCCHTAWNGGPATAPLPPRRKQITCPFSACWGGGDCCWWHLPHTRGLSAPSSWPKGSSQPAEHLAHRETWNEITVLPLPAPSPPQAALGTNTAEAEPQPLLPTTCCGPPCNARAEHPALQLSPSPKLQGEGRAAGAGIPSHSR